MNIVLIGTATGLGLSLTEKMLERGHRVAAGTIGVTPALSALQEKYRDSLLIFEADVTNEEQIQQGAKECAAFMGEIDSLCNAAGVLLPMDREKLLHQCDIAELRTTLEVNTIGPILVVKHFFPYLKKGATVFTVTSEGVGVNSCGTWVPCYGLSKTAATKACGIFNASVEDVDFYAVHPGRMNTEMGRTTAQIEASESADGFVSLMEGTTPISRNCWYVDYLGKPMEA